MQERATYQPSEYVKGSFASKASRNTFIVLLLVFASIYIGSEGFVYYDIALYGYLLATLVFFIGMTLRITAWVLRPPTGRLWKQGFKRVGSFQGMGYILRTFWNNLLLQRFIFRRSPWRGIQHFLISGGVFISFGITFALVLGWMHFELVEPETYDVVMFGIHLFRMGADSALAIFLYHGLNWSGFMVLIGCTMALIRRTKETKTLVEQGKEYDIFPLLLLMAVTISGSLLTVSALWMEGVMYPGISIAHEITVVVMLLYFPFSKFWHIPLRFLALMVPMYHDLAEEKNCSRCGRKYATKTQIEDVQRALKHRNFSVPIEQTTLHMSDLCSECRRTTHRLAAYGAKVGLGQDGLFIQNNGKNGLTLDAQPGQEVDSYATTTTSSER